MKKAFENCVKLAFNAIIHDTIYEKNKIKEKM
jgi:hypothetical protein